MLACSLNTGLDYVTNILQQHPSLNHYIKLRHLLGERGNNFSGVFAQIDT